MQGPLSGFRIIELPAIGPVPFLGMLLADLGAEIVRIDRLPGAQPELGAGVASGPLGRGRRSLGLDLRSAGATDVVLRLAEQADALIEGFRPGVAERLGIGPGALHARNAALVYGRMTGWGQLGPLSPLAGHDITYLAISGLLYGIGPKERPIPPINYVADFGGGAMFLATGLLAALLHARATGQGQVVDAAMTDGAAYLGSLTRAMVDSGGWRDERQANILDGAAPNYRCYQCADGGFVAVGAIERKFWENLVTTLGASVEAVPSPYDVTQWERCIDWLSEIFARRTRDEWAETFASVDACVAPVLTLAEAPVHPHNLARGTYSRIGDAIVPSVAPRFSRTPTTMGTPVSPGQDSLSILAELGYHSHEIAQLRASGAIA